MHQTAYEACQDEPGSTRREAHGLDEDWCRYCGGEPCVDVESHIEREIAWAVYAGLRDAAKDPLKDYRVPDGFYGTDYPDVVFPAGGCFER